MFLYIRLLWIPIARRSSMSAPILVFLCRLMEEQTGRVRTPALQTSPPKRFQSAVRQAPGRSLHLLMEGARGAFRFAVWGYPKPNCSYRQTEARPALK